MDKKNSIGKMLAMQAEKNVITQQIMEHTFHRLCKVLQKQQDFCLKAGISPAYVIENSVCNLMAHVMILSGPSIQEQLLATVKRAVEHNKDKYEKEDENGPDN